MASVCDFNQKPVISYPSHWEYKIFLELEADEKIVADLLKGREFKLVFSRQNAKYKCFGLNLIVLSEKDRLDIFNLLKNHFKFVL